MNQIAILEGKNNILMPAHNFDAGHDLIAISDPEIVGMQNPDGTWQEIQYIEYDTGVKLAPINPNSFCLIFPRSSLSKTNLVLSNSVGVIDSSYRGSIKARFKYIPQPHELEVRGDSVVISSLSEIYHKGDRIGQAIFFPLLNVNFFDGIEGDFSTTRGDGGFGSTGK